MKGRFQIPPLLIGFRALFLLGALGFGAVSAQSYAGQDKCHYGRLGKNAERAEKRRQYQDDLFSAEKRPVSTSEANIATDLHQRILPLLRSKGVRGEFFGAEGLKIHYFQLEHPHEKGAVVISHGFAESLSFYPELIYNLYERGYSVHFLDHRGHGRSGRLSEQTLPVYLDRFQNYAEDLNTFCPLENVIHIPNANEEWKLLEAVVPMDLILRIRDSLH